MSSLAQQVQCDAATPGAAILEFGAVYPPTTWSEIELTPLESADRLREVHHRVKNDLQMVASMLALQARQSLDEDVMQELRDAAGRIMAVARLHEHLQRTEVEVIDITDYLEELCGHLRSSNGCADRGVDIVFAGDRAELAGETAMSLGLILNELVTNALKHAHQDRPGQIAAQFRVLPDTFLLSVADEGLGLRTNGLENANGIGLSFVRATARKLGGELVARNQAIGAEISVSFPRPQAKCQPVLSASFA